MSKNLINLYSDTQTCPTQAMRRVMAQAEVGDEQRGEDPSVNRLCELVAERLGKEAAVFLPSGTMCNEIAILAYCRPGDEILSDRTAHILNFEGGGPAALAGALVRSLEGARGIFSARQLAEAIRAPDRYAPRSRMVVIEQTSNLGGGAVWPLARIREVAEAAHAQGLIVHMDGARLLNAVVASGVSAQDYAEPFDSAWIDLSKGLGCPVGAVLAGPEDFITEAWRWKQRIGGAMRQAGILAAAGIYALEHHVERLEQDHYNARRFAQLTADCPGVNIDLEGVQSNMIFIDVSASNRPAPEISRQLEERGVRIGAMGETLMRAVTHLDVSYADVEEAAGAFREALAR